MKDRLLPVLPIRFDCEPANLGDLYFRSSPENGHLFGGAIRMLQRTTDGCNRSAMVI